MQESVAGTMQESVAGTMQELVAPRTKRRSIADESVWARTEPTS